MNVSFEKVTYSLKGVASMLATMSEVAKGRMIYNKAISRLSDLGLGFIAVG